MLYFISRMFYVCGPEDDVTWKVETPTNCSLGTVRNSGDSRNVISVTAMWSEKRGFSFCLECGQDGHTDLR